MACPSSVPSLPFLMDKNGAGVFQALRGLYDVDLLYSLLFDDTGVTDSRGRHLMTWADTDPEYIGVVFKMCEGV